MLLDAYHAALGWIFETAIIPEADHSLVVSRPDAVVRAVLDFLDRRGLT